MGFSLIKIIQIANDRRKHRSALKSTLKIRLFGGKNICKMHQGTARAVTNKKKRHLRDECRRCSQSFNGQDFFCIIWSTAS